MSEKPVDTLRDGALKATVWRNEGENGSFFTTTLSRTYTDERGDFHESNSFSGSELLRVAELARTAYTRTQDFRREERLAAEPQDGPEPDGNSRRETFDRQAGRGRARRMSRQP